jgi:hypothetical protein
LKITDITSNLIWGDFMIDVPKRKVLGWYSLVFEGILTLIIDLKKRTKVHSKIKKPPSVALGW